MSYSGEDRAQHIQNALKIVSHTTNPVHLMIGRGTGGYYNMVRNTWSLMVTNVSEAYNLFLSTIIDRGLIGFIILILVFKYCKKMRIKGNIYSETIYFAILLQGMHWMLTGNFWLYYFWFEIVLLVGFKRYHTISDARHIIAMKGDFY